jgi:hypothetical protein
VILVISNVANESADTLVGMFPPGAASLVTASDFNTSFKAAVSVSEFSSSKLVIGGTRRTAGEISGVISTISHFLPQEFYYIEPADREYVCAETSSFLIYFLSELRCRKLNPPSAKALSGLGMHRVGWLKFAHGSGVPIWPVHLKNGIPVAADVPRGLRWLRSTIIGGSIVEEGTPERVAGYMRLLSRAFSMPYLSCVFVTRNKDDHFLVDLASVPDVTVPANRQAMVDYLGYSN